MTHQYTVQDALNNYHTIRDPGHLKQGVYRDEDQETGKLVACALGAAFHAHGMSDARENGCATGLMPIWLVEATPNLFDYPTFKDAVNWSDAVYGRGGLLERSSKLPADVRNRVWNTALANIDLELSTNPCTHENWDSSGHDIRFMASRLGEPSGNKIKNRKEQVAMLGGTVVQYMDEALTAEGV